MSESVEEINKLLIDNYGMDISVNLPKFRIVWTTSQFEKRFEKYQVYTPGGIFLREEQGVFEVPKYANDMKDKWVLEKLMSTNGNPYLQQVAKFSFEPIWLFGAGNSSRQPIWRAVQLLVRNNLYGDPNRIIKSLSDLEREEREVEEKEKVKMKEMISDDTSGLGWALKHGSAVSINGLKKELKGN